MTLAPAPENDLARRVRTAIGKSWWKRPDPVLRDMLFESEISGNQKMVRWGIWAAVLSHVAFGILDVILLPDVAAMAVGTRVGVGVFFLAVLEFCLQRGASRSILHLAAATAIVTGGITWVLAAIGTAYQANLSHYIVCGTIFILGSNLFFSFKLRVSMIASTIITVCYCVAIIWGLEATVSAKLALAVFFVNSLVLSLYLSWRLGLERYHTFLHSLRAQIQERAAIEYGEKLDEIANTDHLTGLRNRRAIVREFQEMRRVRAAGGGQIGVILVDVDYFKKYNDSFGHQAGDDCLTRLSDVFSQTAETHGAIVGRHGGEEFIFLCEVDDTQDLACISADLCQAVKALDIKHPDRGDGLHVITISAGASLSRPGQGMDLDSLLQEADRALYSSKFSGRATWTIFDPDSAGNDMSGQNLTELLKSARSEELVSTVYQPIRDMASGRTIGFETLMRLTDFDGTSISPQVFIPEAERSGTIVELGYWAIERAIRDVRRLDPRAVVSVNVSGVQLRAPGFPLRVAEIVSREEMAPSQLALEITEGMDIFLEAQALKAVEELRGFGLQIWLDDFGTGYAGLACLREYEFDLIKIDKGFLQDSHTEIGFLMLKDMVNLVHHRGVRVLVEGVETPEQMRHLQDLDVELIQGFLIGMPESVEAHLARAREGEGRAMATRRA